MLAGQFNDTERYRVLRRLGAGGMGVVYQVFDRQREEEVALKTLLHAEPATILRFKREFRALAELAHRNLIALHELERLESRWFFTMELLRGEDLFAWLGLERDPARTPQTRSTLKVRDHGDEAVSSGTRSEPRVRLERLVPTLLQLIDGVCALHEAGKLHRDIKPSNVMVSEQGRVVLLDFGLITEYQATATSEPQRPDGVLMGTVAYMAPELTYGARPEPPSDWYSVGVILYQALTGRLPYEGTVLEVISARTSHDPVPVGLLAPGTPAALEQLCMRLLARDPAARPSPAELRQSLLGLLPDAGGLGAVSAAPLVRRLTPATDFVGRQDVLAQLDAAFERVREGAAVAVGLHADSGLGKSAVSAHFLRGLRERQGALVLAGRCYELERVPFKALDSVVDQLSAWLLRRSDAGGDAAVEPFLPKDVPLLTEPFPVLRQVEAVEIRRAAWRRDEGSPDPRERRQRTFAAMRALLAAVAEHAPLVLAIDDLQWGDADSAALLREILRPPAPPLLLLLSWRSADAARSPLLERLLGAWRADDAPVELRELQLGALDAQSAEKLCWSVLERARREGRLEKVWPEDAPRPAALERLVAGVVAEAEGSPLFLEEMMRYVLDADASSAGEGLESWETGPLQLRLDRMVQTRLESLGDAGLALLELVALSGRPVPESVLLRARRGLGADGVSRETLAALRAGRLLLGRGGRGESGDEPWVESYHDRIREVVAARVAPERSRAQHAQLAEAWEARQDADPEVLLWHFKGAEQPARAGKQAIRAARRASEALAFRRAAELYAEALTLQPEVEDAWTLRAAQAGALANDGRATQAGEVFAAAAQMLRDSLGEGAEVARDERVLHLERQAAEQYLRAGSVDAGVGLLSQVLQGVGLAMQTSPGQALLGVARRRATLRLRGLGYRPRPEAEIPRSELVRADACWSAGLGLSMVDSVRSADFQARYVLHALQLGEPLRVARALATEAVYIASVGGAGRRKRSDAILSQARTLTDEVDSPELEALTTLCAGGAAFFGAAWKDARSLCTQAEQLCRERCRGVSWEMASSQLFALWSQVYLGELDTLAERLPALIEEAQDRGDTYGGTNLRLGMPNFYWLLRDDPDAARRRADEAIGAWSQRGFHSQHYFELLARTHIALYEGRESDAFEGVEALWPELRRNHLLRLQLLRVELRELRGRSALAAATRSAGQQRSALLGVARKEARKLGREDLPGASGLAALLRGGIQAALGQDSAAEQSYAGAADGLDAAGLKLHARAARWRGGDASTLEDLAAMQVAAPARLLAVLAPRS